MSAYLISTQKFQQEPTHGIQHHVNTQKIGLRSLFLFDNQNCNENEDIANTLCKLNRKTCYTGTCEHFKSKRTLNAVATPRHKAPHSPKCVEHQETRNEHIKQHQTVIFSYCGIDLYTRKCAKQSAVKYKSAVYETSYQQSKRKLRDYRIKLSQQKQQLTPNNRSDSSKNTNLYGMNRGYSIFLDTAYQQYCCCDNTKSAADCIHRQYDMNYRKHISELCSSRTRELRCHPIQPAY